MAKFTPSANVAANVCKTICQPICKPLFKPICRPICRPVDTNSKPQSKLSKLSLSILLVAQEKKTQNLCFSIGMLCVHHHPRSDGFLNSKQRPHSRPGLSLPLHKRIEVSLTKSPLDFRAGELANRNNFVRRAGSRVLRSKQSTAFEIKGFHAI